MCCSSNQAAFAWIAAILVNLGFLSLISWGAATLWPLGCLLSALYTCFLFGLANWLEKSGDDHVISGEDDRLRHEASEDSGDDDNTSNFEGGQDNHGDLAAQEATGTSLSREPGTIANRTRRASPVLVSVLYGLAVVSFGVTGFFFPVNLVETCDDATWEPKYIWKTNITELPPEVQSWAKQSTQSTKRASFGYVESTGVTLFRGIGGSQNGDPPECVWATSGKPGEAPVQYKEYMYPEPFVPVSNNSVCFQAEQGIHFSRGFGPAKADTGFALHCSDGKTFAREANSTRVPDGYLHSFKAIRGELWFKKDVISTYKESASGTLIYKLDPETMMVSLYSKRVPKKGRDSGDGPDAPCDEASALRRQALWALVTSAIPMTALSLGLWKTKSIPSMGSLLYVSLSLVYISLHVAVAPASVENSDGTFFRWWFAVSGALCMLLSTYLLLSSSSSPEGTSSFPFWLSGTKNTQCLRLGLQTSAVGFAFGASLLIMYSDNGDRDKLGWWILLNCLVFWPLLVLGAASNTTFLLVLGGLGFLADAARIAALVDTEPLVVFLIFCCSGMLVGAMGIQLSRYQEHFESAAKRQVQALNQRLLQSGVLGSEGQEELIEEVEDTANEPLVTRV